MHVSRQPNSERCVQSNSPFSLVLRDRVDSKLAVAWSKLLAKANWDWEWDWLREQWDGEAGEWEREWRKWVTDQCVRGWDSEWERESALRSVWERGWGWGWVTVESDLCEVSEALFLKMSYLKLESLRLSFTLSKPSLRDSSLTRGIYVELES